MVSVIIFALARASGDPRGVLLSDYATPEEWELVGRELGLDKPVVVQYWIFMKGALRGDFGISIRDKRPVTDVTVERLPATFQLGAAAFGLSLLIGVPLGVLASIWRGTPSSTTRSAAS